MTEWKECKIADLGTVIGGATPSTKDPANYENGTIAWITPKDLSTFTGRYIKRGERNITEIGLKSCSTQLLPANSVLFSSRAPIGYIAIAANAVCTNQGFKSVIPNDDTDPLFLYYLLKYNKDTIESMGSGTTFKEVSGNTMKGIAVRVPTDISVQKRISAVLGMIDDKIEENERINDNLEQHAKALVRQYCKKITSSVELGTILSFENGFAFQSSSYHEKGKYRIITIKNVQDGRIDSQGASCIDDIPLRMKKGCILSIGDVLLSLTGNVGRVGIVCEDNLLLNQRVAKFVPNDIRILPLLYFYFRLPSTKTSLETISKGTAQQNLSPIETLKLEIPYEALQALELSNLLQPMFNTIYQKSIENIQLAEIRDSLLPRLMSGELDVSAVEL